MENDHIFYYDGTSARPSMVRVLVFNDQLHLRKDEEPLFDEVFSFSTAYQNTIGSTQYLYLDKAGLKYLKYPLKHQLASTFNQEIEKNKGNWAQKLSKQGLIVLLSIVILLSAGLYFISVNLIPLIGMRIIGVEQEIKIGDKLKDLTLKETLGIENSIDTTGGVLLQQFANQLQLSSKYPIRVTLLKSDIVNAYALPGGNIVVYKGILQKIETAEELSALLAHESTHVNERHTLHSLLSSTADGILISIIFGDASGISGAIAGHAETLNGLRYSRSLEAEADEKGMELMLANEVNVTGMRQLMQMLQREDKLPGALAFLSTHPLTEARVAAAEKYLSKHAEEFKRRNDLEETFRKLKDETRQ